MKIKNSFFFYQPLFFILFTLFITYGYLNKNLSAEAASGDEQNSLNHQIQKKNNRIVLPLAGEPFKRGDTSSDYDEVTGEPICTNCHTGDKRAVVDYTTDSECLKCHSTAYSDRFLEMDEMFRIPTKEITNGHIEYAKDQQTGNTKQGTGKSSAKSSSYKIPEGMVLIPGGEFIMGIDGWWPKSGPQHKRTLPDFLMDKYEITNRQFNEFVKTKGYSKPEHWMVNGGNIPKGKEEHPVTYVNWFDAEEYCKWQGKRLPTEPEWEKAARGKKGFVFPWGNEFEKNRANTPQYGAGDTVPVGSFKGGESPYGVDDMAGNVFEWTADWYKAYPGNTHSDPNEGERYRVVRGGSWYDCTYYKCGISAPSFNRIFFNPFTRNNNFGFRCVKDVN
jgi:formylglycine-generating enzyme required for sulfatase activity